ncbi:MAG: pilus assembly protein PilM [Myxococcota bacterium]
MFERVVLGLDVGSYSVKAVELRADLRRSELLRFEEHVFPLGASRDEIAAGVADFLEEHGLSRERVVAALPTERVTQRHLRFPFSGAKKIAQAIDFQIHDELPFPLEETIRAHEYVGLSAGQTDVLVVIAPREDVGTCLEALRRMQVEPRILEVEGAVLANLSPYLSGETPSVAILDVGHGKTNLCLVSHGKPVLLRRIPIAGRHFTEAIARDKGLRFEEAQAFKHEYGVFERASTKPATPLLGSALDRLARETLRSLQSMLSDAVDPATPKELVIAGGSAQLRGLSGFLGERTGLRPVELSLENGPRLGVGTAKFAQATALALRGAGGKTTTRLDFRQDEFTYTADLSALRPQLQLSVALFAMVLALWLVSTIVRLVVSESQVEALEQTIASIHQQTFPQSPADGDVMRVMELEFGRTRELADHLGVTGRGLSTLDALREISMRVPTQLDVTFDELRIDRKNITGRGHTPDFVSADQLRRQLSRTAGFGKVLVSDVTNDTRRGGRNFTLKIRLEEES